MGVKKSPPVIYTSPGDKDEISRLVQAYGAIPGQYAVPVVRSCPAMPMSSESTAVTFTSASGHVWMATARSGCEVQVSVSYDGQPLGRSLGVRAWLGSLL